MEKIDYKKLGLKIGLELHQQLDTNKLFCSCPSILLDRKPDFVIKRYLRAAAGESGLIDVAAKFEELKGKYFVYEGYRENSCLVETDSEPPHGVNEKALEIALQVTLLLNAKIVDEVEVMRKTVVDGSNTSGFQRTMLIARGGFVDTSKGKVRVGTICLEEDAARIIKIDNEKVVYRLDRLGIPLLELTTEPDIKSPEHAKEVAEKLGMILRSTESVKRGIGSIRQDINLSVKNKPRVEIKGFQDLRLMPKIIEKEIKRQLKLKKFKKEVRKVESDGSTSFLRPMPGASRMYPETDIKAIRITKEIINSVKLPMLLTEKAINFEKKYKINAELATLLVKERVDFDSYVKRFKNINVRFLARVLVLMPKEIKKRFNLKVSKSDIQEILDYLNYKEIIEESVFDLLVEKAKGKKIDLKKVEVVSDKDLEKEIKKIVSKKKGLSLNAYMGLVMEKYKGKVSGEKVASILKKVV